MKIDFDDIKNGFEKKANTIYHDDDRLKRLLISVKDMTMENKQLVEIFDDIKTMVNLLKDWLKGDYHELKKSSVIMIIIAFLYLISPIDIIPDFLPGGFIDDIAVLGYVFKKLNNEINRYKNWKAINGSYQEEQDLYERDDFIEINLDDDVIQGEYDIYNN